MPMKISCIPRLFSISHSNYNKNKRSSQCDCWRKSKHSKCRYTCEKRRGLTGIYLQSSKQILCGPTPEKQGVPADHRNALFSFLGKSQALIHIKVYAGIFMFTSLVFICVGFSVIGSSVAGFTVTGFFDDGLANSGSFLKRSEFVFVVLLTPFSAWDMKNIQGGFRLWLTNEKIRHFRPLFLH